MRDEAFTRCNKIRLRSEPRMSFTNKTAVIARGTRARLRLNTAPAVIYTRLSPSEIGVVRFTVQESDNRRVVWVVSRMGSNAGEFYPEDRHHRERRVTDETL
jgi:hypothetical protein